MITQDQINTVAKVKCDNDLLFFTRYFFKKNFKKKFVVNDHHKIICDALEKVYTGDIKKLIINIAPRYGKTELAVKNFIAKGFAINPASKFLHVSYSQELAVANSEEIRDSYILNPEYQALYEPRLKPSSTQKKKWSTTQGGTLYATATGGQVTGFGAGAIDEYEHDDENEEEEDQFFNGFNSLEQKIKFSGAIIIDDPIKPEDADHKNQREKVNNRYESTLKNRVNSVNTPIIVIMQRLHEDDLCGHLMKTEPGEWTVISLPCIQEDEKGEQRALWEFKHDLSHLLKEQKRNPTVFGRQYMQNPMPAEGILFPKQELNWYKSTDLVLEDADFVLSANDVADEGADSYSMPIAWIYDTKVYVNDVLFNKKGLDVQVRNIKDKVNKNKIKEIYAETNGPGKKHIKNLKKEILNCTIKGKHNSRNKEARILNEEGFIKIYFYFRADYDEDSEYAVFISELTNYLKEGPNAHDDAPDSCALLASVIYAKFKSRYLQ
jgi:predicted phage terminase large subunit-like protein